MKTIAVGTVLAVTLIAAGPVSAELLLQYKYDEGSGSSAADTGSGAPANGTLTGAGWTTNTPSGTGAALDLSGASAETLKYVTAADPNKLDSLSKFTLSTWVNLQESPTGNRRILAKQDVVAGGFTWNVSNAGDGSARSAAAFSTRLFIGNGSGLNFDPIPTDPTYVIDADNKWTFLAVTYDGTLSEGHAKYYIGRPDAPVTLLATTTIQPTAGAPVPTDASFGVGYTDAAPANNLTMPGFIDDSRVYDEVLTLEALEAVRLENLASPGVAGDVNGDGVVNLGDINYVTARWLNTGAEGDANGDGVVNLGDINYITARWLNTSGPGGVSVAALAAVPEPASLGAVALAAVGCSMRRRRQAK